MENLILSIAIPTYNRSKSLHLLLISICEQLSLSDQNKLEVLIFDNCSEDDTETVARAFASKYTYIRYVRNETNKGSDANFVKAFWASQGNYLWMIGDDELLLKGAIHWVIHHCEQKVFGCAYLSSISAPLESIDHFLNQSIPDKIRTRRYQPWPFTQAVNYRLTFLSGSVIHRRAVLSSHPTIGDDIQYFLGSGLVHLTWILSAVLSTPSSLMVTTPLFASTVGNSSGYNPVQIFIVNLSKLFDYYFHKTTPSAQKFIRWFTLIGWFPHVIYQVRFSEQYQHSGYEVTEADFPADMRRGMSWMVFYKGVLRGSKVIALMSMLLLKSCHKIIQALLLRRSM